MIYWEQPGSRLWALGGVGQARAGLRCGGGAGEGWEPAWGQGEEECSQVSLVPLAAGAGTPGGRPGGGSRVGGGVPKGLEKLRTGDLVD